QIGSMEYNSNNSAGGVNQVRGDVASVNLRDIGTGNTLMLLNGRRMVLHPGFHNEGGVPVVSPNMNTIPAAGIDRLEVLMDGAAALYGADAVAGIINNVIRNDYQGSQLKLRYGAAQESSRDDISAAFAHGFEFNDGASHFSLFADASKRSSVEVYEMEQTASGDMRHLVADTIFADTTAFDNRSSHTAWGTFKAVGGPVYDLDGKRITDSSGGFHLQPTSNDGCLANISDSVCIDNGSSLSSRPVSSGGDRNLYYDYEGNRQLVPERQRYNVFTTLSHEFDSGLQWYNEASYYYAQTQRKMEHPTVLSTARMIIPKQNYYNPFGALTLADGSPNPNRLDNVDIPDEGLDLVLYKYRLIDAGRRESEITNKSYRLVSGLRGDWGNWKFDTGVLYSKASSDDLTFGGVSSTLLQQALARNTPDAYNPFNGAGDSILIDKTPNPAAVIADIQTTVSKYGETELALADFKLSRDDLLSLPAGDVGLALGIEARHEAFVDDRGPHLDGSAPFVDLVSGVVSQSDALGNSPTNDSDGSRRVYSAFAETVLPLVSPDMNIPLVNELQLQLAGRYEAFSDVDNVFKPRAAMSWSLTPGFTLRALYSEGFRAPNLVQVNDTGLSRINSVVDYYRCQAMVIKGIVSSDSKCGSTRIERVSEGNQNLKPEDSRNTSIGFVFAPDYLPGLTVTLDHWKIEQENLVGLFGNSNHSQLDLFMRNSGSSNQSVVRAPISEEDIALFDGSGLAPVGEIVRIYDPYANLQKRTIAGEDLAIQYEFETDRLGLFKLRFNAAHLSEFEQKVGSEGQVLLDNGVSVSGLGDLIERNGRPKWRYNAKAHWRQGPWGLSLYGRYVGSFNDIGAKVKVDDETVYWRIKPHFTLSAAASYQFKGGSFDGSKLRLGVKNLFNEAPPIADERYGFF
ncbi:MAG: TonB-dependent receptor, partial [Cellvibrionaceae bacterium]|nr:TonB-dependent receptor [Cellvibrionaceae bacterium]